MTGHMTPERWRAVNAVLQSALSLEPSQREAFIADACADDDALRREVMSLLAAHHSGDDDFLEQPAAEAVEGRGVSSSLVARLAKALAGRYEIEPEVARGGMATVHPARDLRHDRRVAIKVLREEIAAAVGAERFLEEIRVTASLQHPHILPLFDSGSADGLLWYVMPFVEGETLRDRLTREGQLPVDVTVQLAGEIADALEYAHSRGIVHRDVKPENVLLQGGHALVGDFGIALAVEHAGGERLTRTGITLGTPQYMAPEQAAGDRKIDARTDVYALGAVVHEMLAGESPFAAASRQDVFRRVLQEPPTALAARRAEVSSSIDAAVRRALAKRPDDRFPSATAFAAALARPAPDVDDRRAEPGRPRGRLISARFALYAAMVMAVVGVGAGWWLARSSVGNVATAVAQVPARIESSGWAAPRPDGNAFAVVDRSGRSLETITANRAWTPRFSPDGRLLAYGAAGSGRSSSDIWVTDVAAKTTRRITDDEADSNDPQWSPDGTTLAYSVTGRGGKDLASRGIANGRTRVLASREGTQFPTDWRRDGSALLFTDDAAGKGFDIFVQPADGSPPWPFLATKASESAARFSPDGRWVAYSSDESGRSEVYIDSYPQTGRSIRVSWNGGAHPVWRGDGAELFYWSMGALVAVPVSAPAGDKPPSVGTETVLFKASYNAGWNTMYDVSPDGQRFVLIR